MHFSEILKLQYGKKTPYMYIALYFAAFSNNCGLLISNKMHASLPPIFFLD